MEQNEFRTLPPEIWSLVLSHLEDFHDLINLKIVNRLFCNELTTLDPLRAIASEIENSKEHLSFLRNRDTSYVLPRNSLQQNGSGQLVFKTIVVGAMGVGKSLMISYFVRAPFAEDRYLTIGSFTFVDPNGTIATIKFWDSIGERHKYPRVYYRGAQAVLLCFSIDNKQSLISLINNFVPDMCGWLKTEGPEKWPVMYLLGLKSDLESKRQVSTNIGKALAHMLKVKYFECSSKLNKNLSEMMHEMQDDLLKAVRVPQDESVSATNPSNMSASRWCSIQ